MDNVMMGIIGEDKDAAQMLKLALREFPCKRVVLISPSEHKAKAAKIAKELEVQLNIGTRVASMKNNESLEDVFTAVKRVNEEEQNAKCVICTETDYVSSCLALSSAFVNGIQAIGILNNRVIAYPVMKFSYYNALTQKKMRILNFLYETKDWTPMEQLQKRLKMSAPLISYHINGNLKSQGLKEMELIETYEEKGRLYARLSTLGKLLSRGLVKYDCDTCEK